MTSSDLAARHAHLRADAIARLAAYDPGNGQQRDLREHYLAHLATHPDGTAKAGPAAHLTASCLVLDESGSHVLLTLHRRAKRWFQFGGHLEETDADLWSAARREAREESGISHLEPEPEIIQLDRHELLGDFGACRAHLDVRFVARVPDGSHPAVSEESDDVRWWPVDDLPEGPDSEIAALVAAARGQHT